MDLGLKGRVALVAAASGGIGYASALELAREGARVIICSRDEGRIREAAEKIRAETGAEVAALAADVTRDEDAAAFVSAARREAGRGDVVVSKPGVAPGSTFEGTALVIDRPAFVPKAPSVI